MSKRGFFLSVMVAAVALGCGNDTNSTGGAGGAGGSATNGAGGSTANGAGGSTNNGTGGNAAAPQPDPQYIPEATGACPEFADGDVTFAPAGIDARKVRIWVGDNPSAQDGPLVFYWHGTGSSPSEVNFGIGQTAVAEILAQGGIVAAPYSDPNSGTFPWYLTTGGSNEDDLLVADEVLACAREKVGIDMRRIHVSGMSAGGLNTTQMSYRRSGYVASVAPYSGGLLGTPTQQEDENKFAAMIFHGGPQDTVVVNFQDLSEKYRDDINGKGHFSFICNHNLQHTIPQDAQASVWQFFQDHPFGTTPPPYADSLPGGFPDYCAL